MKVLRRETTDNSVNTGNTKIRRLNENITSTQKKFKSLPAAAAAAASFVFQLESLDVTVALK